MKDHVILCSDLLEVAEILDNDGYHYFGNRLREAEKLIKDQERKINDQRASMKELMLKCKKCKEYLATPNGSANMNRRSMNEGHSDNV